MLITFSENYFVRIIVILYSIFVLFRVLDYLDYGKGFFKIKFKKNSVDKYLFIFGNNEYFEESIVSASDENYLIEKFETVYDDYKKKNIEGFIIYNEKDNFIERDINKIYEIRRLFNTAVFFISTAENLKKYSYILKREKNIYFVEEP
jgi:hypothetical protein